MNWKVCVLVGSTSLLAGCRGSTVLAGNLTAMAIVVFMLWSTININRR